MIPTVQGFSSQFLADYSPAFSEMLLLSRQISENTILGKQSVSNYYKAQRLLIILNALDSPDLTAKEIEALEYCLIQITESAFRPTITSILPQEIVDGLEPEIDLVPFLIGVGADAGDFIGLVGDGNGIPAQR